MMTKTMLTLMAGVLLAGCLLVGLPGESWAVEETTWLGKDVSLQVGYKVWLAKWQTSLAAVGLPVSATSSWTFMTGPAVTLTLYNRFFVSGQYLTGSYDFSESIIGPNGLAGTNGIGFSNGHADRRDLTLTAGARIWRGVGVFGGYYQNFQSYGDILGSAFVKGPIVGLFAAERLGESNFSLYGNLAMGWLTYHLHVETSNNCDFGGGLQTCAGQGPSGGSSTDSNFSTDDVKAYSGELGVNWNGPSYWKVSPSLQLGFRYQVLRERFGPSTLNGLFAGGAFQGGNNVVNDVTWGPILQASLRF